MPSRYRTRECGSPTIAASTAVDLDAVLRRELRLHVGRGRRLSCEELGDALEVSPRRIKAIRDGEQRAGLDLGLRIAALLGAGVLNRLLEHVGHIARPLDGPAPEVSAHGLLADLGEEVASLSRKLEDGRLDHRERRQLERELSDLQARIETVRASLGVEEE